MEFVSANGISMSVEVMGSPNGSTVMFSNSLAADMEMWREPAVRLAEKFNVILFDARGHGSTEATQGDYTLSMLGQDVLSLMDCLEMEKVHFVGLSLGGMIGQWLAVNAQERLQSLTLCATFSQADPVIWEQRVDAVRSMGVEPVADATLQRWLTEPFRRAESAKTDDVRKMILRTSMDGYAGCAAAIRDMDIADYPQRINVPTLVIAAEQDPSSPPHVMKQIHEQITGSEYELIRDAAHVFTVEQPEETARIIGAFIGRQEETRS